MHYIYILEQPKYMGYFNQFGIYINFFSAVASHNIATSVWYFIFADYPYIKTRIACHILDTDQHNRTIPLSVIIDSWLMNQLFLNYHTVCVLDTNRSFTGSMDDVTTGFKMKAYVLVFDFFNFSSAL
jgi:hypothetical protein